MLLVHDHLSVEHQQAGKDQRARQRVDAVHRVERRGADRENLRPVINENLVRHKASRSIGATYALRYGETGRRRLCAVYNTSRQRREPHPSEHADHATEKD